MEICHLRHAPHPPRRPWAKKRDLVLAIQRQRADLPIDPITLLIPSFPAPLWVGQGARLAHSPCVTAAEAGAGGPRPYLSRLHQLAQHGLSKLLNPCHSGQRTGGPWGPQWKNCGTPKLLCMRTSRQARGLRAASLKHKTWFPQNFSIAARRFPRGRREATRPRLAQPHKQEGN